MKKVLLVFSIILLFSSCDEDSNSINQQELINLEKKDVKLEASQPYNLNESEFNKQMEAFIENAKLGVFFSDFIKSSDVNFYRTFETKNIQIYSKGGVNNPPVPSCNTDFDFSNPVILDTEWEYSFPVFGNHTTNQYTDYYLEQFFRSNWGFNWDWFFRPGPPVLLEQVTTDVAFADAGYEDFITGERVYDILGDTVSVENGEYILQELACGIIQYMADNHPSLTWPYLRVYDVNLVTDLVFSGSSSPYYFTRVIRAEFKVGTY